jgi:acetyl esterase/lipase
MITDFDDAYTNGAYIPEGASYAARWASAAADFRSHLSEGCRAELDLAYGPAARNRFDLFHPQNSPKGLAVFVHGGYWMRFSKDDFSHLAAGALARGWAVALPNYTLAPEITIGGITAEIAKAIVTAAARVSGPVRLAGHSAGGHLVTRMVCEPSHLPLEVLERVERVISISGVHDLRPLMRTQMNATLKLTELEARNESPALRRPRPGVKVDCWVGAAERPEFIRQSELLANIWHGLGADIALEVVAGRHHFDIIAGLSEPGSQLAALLAP